jgi:SAM-dependent methyltransferase
VRFARANPGRPIRVLDVATGSGDVPIGLWRKAKALGIPLVVEGCDISPTAVRTAVLNAADAGAEATFFLHDAIRDPLPTGFDIVTCSLFLHHLSSDDALSLLRRMAEAAGSLVLVNDLARSRFNYLAVWFACHALSRSRVVRYDGPASVRSAFSPREALALARQAGLPGAVLRPRFPCRFLLQWRKPEIRSTKSE